MPQRSTVMASRPGFLADHHAIRRDPGRQIDWANVPEDYRTTPGQTVRLNGAVSAAAVTMTVDPLTLPLPAGTLLNFGEASENIRTTALEPAGETSIAIDPAPTALEDNNEAVVVGSGYKVIRAGTPMDKIDATGLIVPRLAGANVAGRTTIGLLVSDAHEDRGVGNTESLSGYGVLTGASVYEQLLPVTIDSSARTALEGLAGGGIRFEQYSDNRAS